MKKILTSALAVLLLTASVSVRVSASKTEKTYEEAEDSVYCSVCADTDGDGEVTVGDARNILRAAVGLDEADEDNFGAYDVDADGEIGVGDARSALRIAVGLDTRATHDKGDTVTLTEATCAQNGKGAFLCAHCGKIYGYTVLPNPGHVSGPRTVAKKATCTEAGIYEYHCKFCNKLIESVIVDPIPHEFEGVLVSCVNKINSVLTCKNCGATEERVIEPVGHHDYKYVTTKKATCTEDGEKVRQCRVCGEYANEAPTVIPNLGGHKSSGWRIMSTVSCQTEGRRIKVCTVCKTILAEEITPKEEHERKEGSYTVDEQATCEHEGKAHFTCKKCSGLVYVAIPKLEHTPVGEVEMKVATCTAEGYRKGICADCGKEFTDIIPKTSHTKSADWVVEQRATCVSAGKKVMYCAACGEVIDEKEIPKDKNGHGYELIETREPTCTSEGKEIYVCSYCNKENIVSFGEPAEHTRDREILIESSPEKGYDTYIYECTVCGKRFGKHIKPRTPDANLTK